MQYESILKRKSVRKYEDRELVDDDKKLVRQLFLKTKPLIDSEKYELRLVGKEQVTSNVAYNFIEFFGQESKYFKLNCGYVLSQLDIMLSQLGFGTCFLGFCKPKQQEKDSQYGLSLAVGYPTVSVHRESVTEFKRLPKEKLMSGIVSEYVQNAIWLSPSAINVQPYFVEQQGDKLIIYSKRNRLVGLFTQKYYCIDIGIMLNHIELALQKEGLGFEVVDEELEYKDYIISIKLTEVENAEKKERTSN